jgi:predicted Zn-dependent peptidase
MKRLLLSLLAAILVGAVSQLPAQDVTLPPTTRVELDNGVVLLLNEKHDVPLIGLEAVLRGGAVADPADKNGLASLFAALLEKGAGERDSAAFAEAIDSVGGNLGTEAGREGIVISGNFLARDAALLVELLADMLRRPALDKQELDKLRERTINVLRAAKDSDPGELLPIYANAFLFGAHPYANPAGGSETSLAGIDHDDVLEYYEQQVGADRLIIAVSGDFDMAAMQALLSEAFAGWRPASARLPDIDAPQPDAGGRVLLIDKPGATQTYFWMGNVGVARDFADRADLDIANTVFGGRFTSMLNTALRVESGLTYGAQSTLDRRQKPGSVAISSFTESGTTAEAVDMAIGVLAQLHDTGVPAAMVDSARNYVLGQFPTRLETAAQLASQFALLEAAQLPVGYINDYGSELLAVSAESVAAVIDDVYPQRDELVFVFIGDAAVIRDTVSKYGAVTEMSINEPHFRVPAAAEVQQQ